MTLPNICGPVIITRYLGPTDHRGSRVVASHKRDSEKTYRVTWDWDHSLDGPANHLAAAELLLTKWPYLDPEQERFILAARGHDHDAYYFIAIQPWQLQR